MSNRTTLWFLAPNSTTDLHILVITDHHLQGEGHAFGLLNFVITWNPRHIAVYFNIFCISYTFVQFSKEQNSNLSHFHLFSNCFLFLLSRFICTYYHNLVGWSSFISWQPFVFLIFLIYEYWGSNVCYSIFLSSSRRFQVFV